MIILLRWDNKSNHKVFVERSGVLLMRNRILLWCYQDARSHTEFTTKSLVPLRYH